jgi:SAM-dependent methyltransferase
VRVKDRYFIKAGYQANERALTFEGDSPGPYWTEDRLRAAGYYQYYVYDTCRRLVQQRGFKSVMDVGCGAPVKVKEHLAPVCRDIQLVDQPSVSEIAERILPGYPFMPADLEKIDLDLGRKFDLIVSSDVVEHLLNPDNCLDFIRRHLPSHGLAVISTPERDFVRGKVCSSCPKPEHVREWNAREFRQYITSRGFEIVQSALFPQGQLRRRWEYLGSRICSPVIRTRRWSSNQMVVCRAR